MLQACTAVFLQLMVKSSDPMVQPFTVHGLWSAKGAINFNFLFNHELRILDKKITSVRSEAFHDRKEMIPRHFPISSQSDTVRIDRETS